MPKQFKVKYKERHALARALKREIKSKGLVDSGAMLNGIRIAASSGMNLNGYTITVIAPYYYLFQDLGTGKKSVDVSKAKKPLVEGIFPKRTTKDWLFRKDTNAILTTILHQYIEWRMKEYKLLAMAKFADAPVIRVGLSLYGDPTGEWNIDVAPVLI